MSDQQSEDTTTSSSGGGTDKEERVLTEPQASSPTSAGGKSPRPALQISPGTELHGRRASRVSVVTPENHRRSEDGQSRRSRASSAAPTQPPQPPKPAPAAPPQPTPETWLSRCKRRACFFHISPQPGDPYDWQWSSQFLYWWCMLAFVHFLYTVALLPIRICFDVRAMLPWVVLDGIADLFIVVDMWVLSHSAFDKGGFWVTDKVPIRQHYLRSRFIPDLLTVLPVDWILLAAGYSYEPGYRVNRMLRVQYFGLYFVTFDVLHPSVSTNLIRIAKSAATTLFAAHLLACGFFLVLRLEGESSTGVDDGNHFGPCCGRSMYWQGFFDLFDLSVVQQYFRCLHWALISMTGYGNTIPARRPEVLYTIMTTLIGLAIYVHTIASVGSLVGNLQQAAETNRTKVDTTTQWMRYRRLPEATRKKVQDYYEYMWNTRKGVDEMTLLNDLPAYLRLELAEHVNKNIIDKVPLFKGVSQAFLKAVILHLEPRVVMGGSIICKKGDVGAEMFFISSGEVHVVGEGPDDNQRPIFATLVDGSFFGEIALIYQTRRTATVLAGTTCELYILSKFHFDEVLDEFSEYARMILEKAAERFGGAAQGPRMQKHSSSASLSRKHSQAGVGGSVGAGSKLRRPSHNSG